MIVHMIAAAIIAGSLGFVFFRTWNLEHGYESDEIFPSKYGVKTHLRVPATWMFWILLFILALFTFYYGFRDALFVFEALSLKVLAFLSVYFVLLLFVLPLLRKRFSARACATLWLVPTFLFWTNSVIRQEYFRSGLKIYLPRQFLLILGIIWIVGFLAVGGYYLISHLAFRASVKKHSTRESDEETCAILCREQEELDYRWPVTLLRGEVKGPFSMGTTRWSRCIVLPDRSYTPEELSMIFRHELHHLQRSDVETKIFLCLCKAFYWFNPLVWIATRKAAEDLERSCDEIVTEEMEKPERQTYAKLLLDAAAPGRGCTTCLSAAAGTLRYRLKSIMDQRKRWKGTLLLMGVVFVFVTGFGMISISSVDARGSLTSLALPPEIETGDVMYDKNGWLGSAKCDGKALREALDKIEVEHITGLEKPPYGGRSITILFSDGNSFKEGDLNEKSFVITDRISHETEDWYLVKNTVDWDAIDACLYDFEKAFSMDALEEIFNFFN